MADLDALLESRAYTDAVDEVRRVSGIALYPAYPPPLRQHGAKSVAAAGLPLEALENVLASDRAGLVRFAIEKLRKLDAVVREQEYPPGEEPEEGDLPARVEPEGYSKGFLLLYLLEYVLLRDHPDRLDAYLKAKRTPDRKAYAADLRAVFERARA